MKKITPELEKHYEALSDTEQDILKVLAVVYEPLSYAEAYKLFREVKPLIEKNGILQHKDIKIAKKKLTKLGFFYNNAKLEVTGEWSYRLLKEVKKEPYFNALLRYIREEFYVPFWYYDYKSRWKRHLRDLRIALISNSMTLFRETEQKIVQYFPLEYIAYDLVGKIFKPFDPVSLGLYSLEIQHLVVTSLLKEAINELAPIQELLDFLQKTEHLVSGKTTDNTNTRNLWVEVLVMSGEFEKAKKICNDYIEDTYALANLAWIDFLQGKQEESILKFELALKFVRKQTGRRSGFLEHISSTFYLIALLKTGTEAAYKKIIKWTKGSSFYARRNHLITALIHAQRGDLTTGKYIVKQFKVTSNVDLLLEEWCSEWLNVKSGQSLVKLEDKYFKAINNGYAWYAFEMASILSRKGPKNVKADFIKRKEELEVKLCVKSGIDLIRKKESWEFALEALNYLGNTKNAINNQEGRLIWLIDINGRAIQPKEQKVLKSGKWGKGRNVTLNRILEGKVLGITPQDSKIVKHIVKRYEYHNSYYLDFDSAIIELIGHPLLFLANSPTTSLDLIKAEPNLVIKQAKGGYVVEFSEGITSEEGVQLIKETNTRYKVVAISEEQKAVITALGGTKLAIPKSGKDTLLETIKHISSLVTVQSEIGEDAKNIPTVAADERLYMQIVPMGEGFKLETFVKPFGTEPPYFKPGKGSKTVITELNKEKVQVKRNLTKEKRTEKELISACRTLQSLETKHGEWILEEAEVCLEVLSEIDPLRDANKLVLEWPKGAKMQLTYNNVSFEQLFLNIHGENDWFELSGELKLNEQQVMSMQLLLQKLDSQKSRFIEVSEGNFIALTQQLRRKLLDIKSFVNDTKDGLTFHKLKGLALEEFLDEAKEVEADKHWNAFRKRIDKARKRKPAIPSTLKAELRDYQKEGYQWLSQLAEWGVGACLADDMGLGKTIQALTVILERTKKGPTLVIAPASVTRNWIKEAQKFAPTLNPYLFGKGDRKEMLDNLKKFDLLVTSYGLMQQEIEHMEKIKWTTVVLDEAQSIKNKTTKRSKAAMKLQSDFKILTTGTPIENHLGELWNLFYFINPGLLGTSKDFNDRYTTPIERMNDKERKKQLKKLIQPFILRRRKTEVLDELPSKTEITLTVEMSAEEMAFYEAARRNALFNLENTQQPPGARHLQILTEIMRLRQVCCNTRLVVPESKIPSSKLELFANIVEELLENGHKALVFSQFVKHLKIIEEYVKKKKISYQYLDGSTSMKKRQTGIDAFQSGEGDLFLISLKAGGLGLNLTAADYVIHMDPWWNPAVEDQASDRAHRIGQKRPVTVYRFVTEGTIEGKIVELHEKKRDLADSLLGDTDVSAKLSSSELLKMIREN